ncbi:MAG: heme exporter protein CcmB [Microthrixaceae bacterium]|nr:heme exporter protein CcmB [Microthrixaceae bacterium]
MDELRRVARAAQLVAAKDLRIERRTKVATAQMLPFALLVLLLFAFALDPDRGVLAEATAGLFWTTVLFTAVLAIQRSFAVELSNGVLDSLRLSGLSVPGIFLGKVAALFVQLAVLEVVLGLGVAVLYDAQLGGWALLAVVALAATTGICAAGAAYGLLAARLRQGSALLPLLLLPLLAPVLIAATRGSDVALGRETGGGWSWAALLGVFAVAYLGLGAALYGPLMDET